MSRSRGGRGRGSALGQIGLNAATPHFRFRSLRIFAPHAFAAADPFFNLPPAAAALFFRGFALLLFAPVVRRLRARFGAAPRNSVCVAIVLLPKAMGFMKPGIGHSRVVKRGRLCARRMRSCHCARLSPGCLSADKESCCACRSPRTARMPIFACRRFTVTTVEAKSDCNREISADCCAEVRNENRARRRRKWNQQHAVAVAALSTKFARMKIHGDTVIRVHNPVRNVWRAPLSPLPSPLSPRSFRPWKRIVTCGNVDNAIDLIDR